MGLDEDIKTADTKASLRRQVEDKLRRAIIRGRFAPGEHLSDRALCELYKVSRTVVREAVRQLEAEGLVESVPNRGSFVRTLSVDEAVQIFDTRAVLEAWATRRFVQYATDRQINELVHELEDLKSCVAAGEDIDLVDRKQRFYDMLFAVYKNTYIQNMLNQTQNWSGQLRVVLNAVPDRSPQSIVELDRLVRAIQNRDKEGAWQASLARVQNVGSVALSLLRTHRSDNPDLLHSEVHNGLPNTSLPPISGEADAASPASGKVIEVVLSNGHRLRVDSSIDEQLLKRVVGVLQSQ
jgi:DNA-binding GntR family transcriptional regulator